MDNKGDFDVKYILKAMSGTIKAMSGLIKAMSSILKATLDKISIIKAISMYNR
jgi:hypothetical protein